MNPNRTNRSRILFNMDYEYDKPNRANRTRILFNLSYDEPNRTNRTRILFNFGYDEPNQTNPTCMPEHEQNRTARDWPNRKELEPTMVGLIFCLPCVPRFCEKKNTLPSSFGAWLISQCSVTYRRIVRWRLNNQFCHFGHKEVAANGL